MKKLSKIAKAMLALAVTTLFIVSCANPFSGSPVSELAGSRSLQDAGPATSFTLWAGQTIDAGTVSVSRDADTLYVVYNTNEKFLIGAVHVWVGTNLADLPTNNSGIPAPGQFLYNVEVDPAASEVVVPVSLGSWTEGTTLYLFTHAELIGQNVNGTQYGNETGWAGDKSLNISRWNFYFSYTLPPYNRTVTPTEQISGVAFFDLNGNGVRDADEPGIPGVDISLTKGADVQNSTTGSNGAYLFTGLYPVEYTVASSLPVGFVRTSPESLTVTASGTADFGFALDYNWIGSQTANGYTIGFWKTNIDKAIANSTKGIQVSKATLESYRALLSSFALEPLNIASLSEASRILSSTSSNPVDLLKKQLMGSEFNYANGAYIGGNELVTFFFLYNGEYIVKNPGSYTADQILAAKNWFDAYNNSHGGQIIL